MLNVRGQNVLLDRDVAMLYGVETKRVNEAVKKMQRNFLLDIFSNLINTKNKKWSKILTGCSIDFFLK